ncbi:MAG TPA: NAD-dependent epimerase/dehydratase family protein [Puia sp.]|uniref:NAD-dependent epimerase/dehydratase family protein n=1 Tax=Puia sp. TaxID=2045100 RepID=UPI002D11D624|nr:NAD-dependent epimerase/dehydratase family protein [Puia sp.]HVU98926.1 NAD-dependent epimerase/dehydratase family protein [Puia sp.]
MSNGKILIIGSEGFIGSNAVSYFSEKQYEVWKADIVLKDEPAYTVLDSVRPDFASLFATQRFDVCLNATGAANVQFSFGHPGIDFMLNVANVYAMLDAIREHAPGCKFMNLSSAAVYGNPTHCPVPESAPLQPLSPYGFHKIYSEEVCGEFHRFYQIPTASLRIFSAYGEGLKKQLFWDLYQKTKAAKDGRIELFGTGEETRDFIYVRDILEAIHCVIRNAAFNGQTINIASGQETTIADAATVFLRCLGSGLEPRFSGAAKQGDPLRWKADIGLLKSYGFAPRHGLEDGLKNYTRWLGEKAF